MSNNKNGAALGLLGTLSGFAVNTLSTIFGLSGHDDNDTEQAQQQADGTPRGRKRDSGSVDEGEEDGDAMQTGLGVTAINSFDNRRSKKSR